MRARGVQRAHVLRVSFVAALLCCGCDRADRPDTQTASEPAAPPPAITPAAPVAHEALPRSVGSITLGMARAAAESTLGHLSCHTAKSGCDVCKPDAEQGGEVRHLELYIHHDHVISVSYEGPAPANAWDALNQLIDRYGSPSLSGMRERDQSGRLHEIYGWKDTQSLYSVRFMWREAEAEGRELVGTVTALWDRKGYQQWEAEAQPRGQPPAGEGTTKEPI